MKIFHASDLHLDSPLRGLDRYEGAPAARMRGATRKALENLVDACLAEQVDLLLIAGDLYDGNWKDYGTGLFFAHQMLRLRDARIPVVLLKGNHDAASQITKGLRLPENVHELSVKKPESFAVPSLGVVVHGQGFATRSTTDDLAARYPRAVPGVFNIGMLHTSLDGREGHEPYAPTRLEVLADKGYDYWALGHVHAREVVTESPWVVFCGNLQGRHARETGAKGATLVVVENGRVAKVEHRALDAVRWDALDVDAAAAASADDVIDLVRAAIEKRVEAAEGRPLAARVTVRGATAAHAALAASPERWVSEIRLAARDADDGVWIEKVRLATRATLDAAQLQGRDDAIGQLARALAAMKQDDAALLALRGELHDLEKKLPAELREGADAPIPDDPARLRAIVDDVEQLLFPLLVARAPEAPSS